MSETNLVKLITRPAKQLLMDRMCIKAQQIGPVKYKARPAFTLSDLIASFKLTYKAYLKRGLCPINRESLYFSKFHLSPCARTFMLDLEQKVVGTTTLLEDGELGLPLESLYPAEIRDLRKQEFRIAEVTTVGISSKQLGVAGTKTLTNPRRLHALLELMRIMYHFAIYRELTHLIIAVEPKDEELFRLFNFVPFGPAKQNKHYEGKVTLPMIHNVHESAQKRKNSTLHNYFYKNMTPKSLYAGMFHWQDESLMTLALQSPKAEPIIAELFKLRQCALVSGSSLHKIQLRETFLCC